MEIIDMEDGINKMNENKNYIRKNVVNLYRQNSKMEVNLITRDKKVYLSLSIFPTKVNVDTSNLLSKKGKQIYDYERGMRIDLGIQEISKLLSFLKSNNSSNLNFIHKTDNKFKSVTFQKFKNRQNTDSLSVLITEKLNNSTNPKTIDDVLVNGDSSERKMKFIINDDEIILLEEFSKFVLNKYFELKLQQ
jgi:hypothetical protein